MSRSSDPRSRAPEPRRAAGLCQIDRRVRRAPRAPGPSPDDWWHALPTHAWRLAFGAALAPWLGRAPGVQVTARCYAALLRVRYMEGSGGELFAGLELSIPPVLGR